MKKIILIVDDEAPTRQLLRDVLENEGFKAAEAGNGQEALDVLKKIKADLIILDIMMPQMNGWDTAAQISTDPKLKNIPFIFLTAKSDKTSKQLGKISTEFYIEKPFEIQAILEIIKKAMKK